MRPDLTIAIPTYNRADKLEESVGLAIRYSVGKNVEILISDNASNDDTTERVENVRKNYPNIRYYKNEKNIGFDGNFLNCFEKATGKYVWLLSDDDKLLPGAVDSVLDALKKEPVCMHLNSSTLIDENPIYMSSPRLEENGLLIYEDRNGFIKKIGIFCTFVSSLIFNVDYVRNIENKEQYFNTNILQSHVLLETMKNDGIYIVNTFNCLAARGNISVEYDVLRTWVKNYSDLLLQTAPKCGFDEKVMNQVLEAGLSTTVYEFVINFRKTCKNEATWDRECIWSYVRRYPQLIRKYTVAVNCPQWYLQVLKLIYRIRSKIEGRRVYGEKCN